MKGKTLLYLSIVLSMMLAVVPMSSVKGSPATVLSIEPPLVEDTVPVCNNFTVDIYVTDVVGLWAWKVNLTWDPAVLEVLEVTEGPFLSGQASPTAFVVAPFDPATGFIPEISCGSIKVPAKTATGSGVLATVKFHVIAPGECDIVIKDTVMIGPPPSMDPLVYTVEIGHFKLSPPPPTSPEAIFTPLTCTMVYVGDWVTLDGRASTDGWDTLPDPPGGHTVDINDYKWLIDFLNGTTVEMHGDYIPDAFQCDKPGDVAITLTVNATDPLQPDHSDYEPIDSETHTIHQASKPMGVVIDVYTEKGGEGLGINWDADPPVQWPWSTAWSDAFAPQEEVTVYAKVTYNDDPVQNKPVAFEVKDETGTGVVYRTVFTDADGIASFTFRLIWECNKTFTTNYEVWEIWASVSVSEIEKLDVVKFRYGWLVQIEEIDAPGQVDKPVKPENFVAFEVTLLLKNLIHWPSNNKAVYITVVVYDVCGVPIAVAKVPDLLVPEDAYYWDPIFTLLVPPWTYRGTGMIYANIFTGAPQDGGVPVCSEVSTPIWLGRP